MLYELGLVFTIAICGWIALDLLVSAGWRRRSLTVGCMAAAAGIWAAGDLLLLTAADPGDRATALRVNYLGICALPLAFAAVGAQAARPHWWRHAPLVFAIAALPALFTYSCLFWDSADWFVDYSVRPPRRGPIFYGNMLYAWALTAVAWLYLAKTAMRLSKASPWRMLALGAGTAAPLRANFIHIVVIPSGPDPTPVLSGFGALLRTYGRDLDETLVRLPAALKIAQAGNPERRSGEIGRTRLGMNFNLRTVLAEGRDYNAAWTAWEAKRGGTRP